MSTKPMGDETAAKVLAAARHGDTVGPHMARACVLGASALRSLAALRERCAALEKVAKAARIVAAADGKEDDSHLSDGLSDSLDAMHRALAALKGAADDTR